jgi:hypothetical protein
VKLPPKHRRFARLCYHVSGVFFPDPYRDCNMAIPEYRIMGAYRRLGKDLGRQTGREHEALLGEYKAIEYLRRLNVRRVWDDMSHKIARVTKKPRLP